MEPEDLVNNKKLPMQNPADIKDPSAVKNLIAGKSVKGGGSGSLDAAIKKSEDATAKME